MLFYFAPNDILSYFKFKKQKYIKIKNIAQEKKKAGRSVTISEYFVKQQKFKSLKLKTKLERYLIST